MAVVSNIYPPIIDTYMPAFVIKEEGISNCRIYFSLSLFNTLNQYKSTNNCQVTVRNQKTNISALNSNLYPSEVMITTLKTDMNRDSDDKYYIEIKSTDMANENFIVDQYYKIQIRFIDKNADDAPVIPGQAQQIDKWLSENLLYFSEWSTVCLIRGISEPILTIKDFEAGDFATEIYNTLANIQILGNLTFTDEDENETLRNYRVVLYTDDGNNTKLLDSGDIYTNNYTDVNGLNYPINYTFEADKNYYFTITYTTQNLFSDTLKYKVSVLQAPTMDLKLVIRAWTDAENGRIILKMDRSRYYGEYTGQIIIRRTDSKSNFTIWEDMHVYSYNKTPYISTIWNDYTVESGIWYKYGVQGIDIDGARTPMVEFKNPVMLNFDHIYLTAGDKQLKIIYNPQISSYKRNISESKIDTIGSKYPFIKRNGNVNYISFPIGGLIASAMDEDGTFTSREEIYGDNLNLYEEYNEDNNIYNSQDFIYETFFRKKVEDFLYRDNAVLFRSPSEGNILIRLMNVNFTSNQTLGRRIWSFTADATEIDECTVANYAKYSIYTKEDISVGISANGSSLMPIRRVIFINSQEEFPEIGKEQILYIFNNQIYIWDEENNKYKPISLPNWNEEDIQPINPSALDIENNSLYTDGESLYKWNSSLNEFESLTESNYNQETVGE